MCIRDRAYDEADHRGEHEFEELAHGKECTWLIAHELESMVSGSKIDLCRKAVVTILHGRLMWGVDGHADQSCTALRRDRPGRSFCPNSFAAQPISKTRIGTRNMEVVLLLGANVGDPRATLRLAERLINERVGKVVSRSRDHWTEPWGFTDDRLFLNRALLVNTDLNERAVLDTCLGIEMELGRVRNRVSGYTSRTIDIDLLFAESRTVDEIDLSLIHISQPTRPY